MIILIGSSASEVNGKKESTFEKCRSNSIDKYRRKIDSKPFNDITANECNYFSTKFTEMMIYFYRLQNDSNERKGKFNMIIESDYRMI